MLELDTNHRRGMTIAGTWLVLAPWLTLAGAGVGHAAPQTDGASEGSYKIGAGDELHIIVWRNEDLTVTIPVRPDGWISLPLVNDIEVAGMTPMQLRTKLTDKLQPFVSSPLVSVIVTRVGSFKVSILGNVRRPGRFDLEGAPTALDVIAIAGGPDEFANKDEIYLLRGGRDGFRRISVDYSATIKAQSTAGVNLFVEPGDIIIVP
jgi:polysaccharide biosynthesis/export protein